MLGIENFNVKEVKSFIMTLHRNLLIFSSIFFALLISSCSSEKKEEITVLGTVQNLNEAYVLLSEVEDIQNKKHTLIDTLFVDEVGYFEYKKPLESNIYELVFDHKKKVQLAFVKGQHIIINGNSIDNFEITGSSDTQLLLDYEAFRKESLSRLVYSIRKEITELKKQQVSPVKIAELREVEIENYNLHLKELTDFIADKMGTSIAIYPTSIRWNTLNLESYKEIVSKFKVAHPNLGITRKLEDRVNLLGKTAVGSLVSNIQMPSKEGDIIDLNTIKKKYTLIDFWASWCPPCRTESTLLNELFSSYKDQGFNIYGISLDSKRQRWLDALEKDKRIWPNVSTVEGLNTSVAKEYGVTALPTNFIIDSEGKIVASNVHGKHLKEFVEQLFAN